MRPALWLAVAAAFTGSACGAPKDEVSWKKCEAGAVQRADEVIDGCSAIITAGTEPSRRLAGAHGNRANAYLTKEEFDKALADLDAAIRLEPAWPVTYELRALVLFAKKDYEMAIVDYDKAISLAPKHPAAYGGRGAAYARLGKQDKAVADFTQAIKLGTRTASMYQQRGTALARSNKFDQAVDDFTRAIAQQPDDAITLNNRCFARAAANVELEAALIDCDKALKLSPQSGVHDSRGFVNLRLGKFAEAITDFDEALAANPNAADAMFKRGIAKRHKGDATGGDGDIAAAKALNPDVEREMVNYGLSP